MSEKWGIFAYLRVLASGGGYLNSNISISVSVCSCQHSIDGPLKLSGLTIHLLIYKYKIIILL